MRVSRPLAFLLLLACAARAAEAPLNIVVLDICSARADRFGVYGADSGLTPGLDAFAEESATFENAWAQSSWCLPNYATLLTGHRPEVNGVYTNLPFRGLPDWEETVAERLRKAGYRTGAFTAGVYTLPAWGLDRGFDAYVNKFSTAEARPGRFTDLAPEIEDWIVKDSSRPFFLYATVDDLHSPYQSDEASFDGTALDTETLSVRFFRAYNGEPADAALAAKVDAFRKDPGALKAVRARYDAAVRSTDRSVVGFLQRLKARGLWDRTVVVVTADHGELLGEHALLGHTEGLYEPVLRVPLLIRHPRYPRSAGARVKALVERIDLPPTFAQVGGADISGMEMQGRSLIPLLADPDARWRRTAYASSKRNMAAISDWTIDERAVRDERWKLLWSLSRGRWELYDLKNDPEETLDRAEDRPEVVARLAFELQTQAENARTHAPGRPSGKNSAPDAGRLIPAHD